MQWEHSCSPAWLKARKQVVTATELRDLLASFKKLTKDEVNLKRVNLGFAGVIADKLSAAEPDPRSTGMAARGHIMEPYAIAEFNRVKGTHFHHWDDALIVLQGDKVGFSPDALDVPQPNRSVTWNVGAFELGDGQAKIDLPTSLLEIKSYGDSAHLKAVFTPKEKLKERYQIAAAMLVCPSIKVGYLMFYNPNCPFGIHYKEYTQDDLEDEMFELHEVLDFYADELELIKSMGMVPSQFAESDIWKENTEQDYFSL